MKRVFTLIAILFLLVVLSSCENDEPDEDFLWYRKAETQCADVWDSCLGQSDSILKITINEYLDEGNLRFDEIVIGFDSDLVQACRACSCTTGRFIALHAAGENEEALNAIGFVLLTDE